MAQRAPWHSAIGDVHHVCTNCTLGNNIESENLRPGTGNLRLCDQCRDRQRDGTC